MDMANRGQKVLRAFGVAATALVALLVTLDCAQLGAAELPRAVVIAPDTEVVAGAPIELLVKVRHDRNTRAELPMLPREWGRLHVVEQSVPITNTAADGRLTTEQILVVSVFEPGIVETPALHVTVRKEKAGSTVIETAAPVTLNVEWSDDVPSCD